MWVSAQIREKVMTPTRCTLMGKKVETGTKSVTREGSDPSSRTTQGPIGNEMETQHWIWSELSLTVSTEPKQSDQTDSRVFHQHKLFFPLHCNTTSISHPLPNGTKRQ